ncbi:hypothetical protein [Enemella sp. A6]|uniref:hypothetical protein n=1 Tax=Enemella sp. A6 TaxID=3440152 RepID=UPI003EB6BA83
MTESHVPESPAPENRAPENRAPEGHVTEEHVTEGGTGTDSPPQTGHEAIDAALAHVAESGDPEAITRALDVLQSVLDADPDELPPR